MLRRQKVNIGRFTFMLFVQINARFTEHLLFGSPATPLAQHQPNMLRLKFFARRCA
jgi:hypothetical protein